MNNRQRFYQTNMTARKYILESMRGSHVYFKEHLRRKSKFYITYANGEIGYYQATDFFNLFDGLCIIAGSLCFFQVKTNSWPSEKAIREFTNDKHGFAVFAINVIPKKREIKVKWYDHET